MSASQGPTAPQDLQPIPAEWYINIVKLVAQQNIYEKDIEILRIKHLGICQSIRNEMGILSKRLGVPPSQMDLDSGMYAPPAPTPAAPAAPSQTNNVIPLRAVPNEPVFEPQPGDLLVLDSGLTVDAMNVPEELL